MKKILLVSSIVFTATAFAQKVNNNLSFQKGQKLELTQEVNSTVSSAMGESDIKTTIIRSFDVLDIVNGNAVIEHKIKSIKANFGSAMGSQKFDSDNEKDMKSDAGKSVDKTLKKKYTITLDATGKVISVKKDDDNAAKKEENATADMMGNIISQIAGGINAPEVGTKTEFKILPDREISKGETWIDSVPNSKTVYTLTDVTDNDIIINFTEDATTERTQQAMGMEITISTKDKTKGKITLDKKTGLLKEKTAETNSEGTMGLMGQSVPTTTKTTKTLTVKNS